MEDSRSSFCCICKKKFSIITRRHHCRRCGQLFCKACCPKVVDTSNDEDERLCSICRKCLKTKEEDKGEILEFISGIEKNVRKNNMLLSELTGLLSFVAIDSSKKQDVIKNSLFEYLVKKIAESKKDSLNTEERYFLLQYLSLIVNLSATVDSNIINELCDKKVHETIIHYMLPSYDLAIREMVVWALRGLSQNGSVAVSFESSNIHEILNSFNSLMLSRSNHSCINATTLLANIIRHSKSQFGPLVVKSPVLNTLFKLAGLTTSQDLMNSNMKIGGGQGSDISVSGNNSPTSSGNTRVSAISTMISNKTTGPVVFSEEIVISALRAIRCTISGSALGSFRVLECYSSQLFENMNPTTDSGILRSMILLSMVQTLLNTPEEDLEKLPRMDFTNESKLTYDEVINCVDISLVFKNVMDSNDDIKAMVLQESKDIAQKIFLYKLKPTNIASKEALLASTSSIIASNLREIREYIASL